MKKIITSLICILTAVCLIFGCSLNVLADDGWGTEEAGIYAPHNNYVRYYKAYTEKSGCPNPDFSLGYRFWTTDYNNKDSKSNQVVEASRLEKDGDNTYIVMTPHFQYDNIATVMFTDDRIKLEDKITVLYDWHNTSGTANLQIVVYQYVLDANGKCQEFRRIADASDAGITDLVLAFNDTDWNTSMSRQRQDLLDPSIKGDGKFYFSIVIESTTDFTEHGTKVDNLRLARFNKTSGDVYDLDGKRLYNINELDMGGDIDDTISEDDFADIDYEAENEELTTGLTKEEDTKEEDKKSFIESYNMFSTENWQGSDWWKPAVATGAIVIVVAGIAVAVILVVISKKKKAAAAVEQPEATEEIEDNTDQNIIE